MENWLVNLRVVTKTRGVLDLSINLNSAGLPTKDTVRGQILRDMFVGDIHGYIVPTKEIVDIELLTRTLVG